MRPISVVSIRDLDCASSVEIAFVEWDGWGLHAAHKSVNVIIICIFSSAYWFKCFLND